MQLLKCCKTDFYNLISLNNSIHLEVNIFLLLPSRKDPLDLSGSHTLYIWFGKQSPTTARQQFQPSNQKDQPTNPWPKVEAMYQQSPGHRQVCACVCLSTLMGWGDALIQFPVAVQGQTTLQQYGVIQKADSFHLSWRPKVLTQTTTSFSGCNIRKWNAKMTKRCVSLKVF